MIKIIFFIISVWFVVGCGVKGDPLPPVQPPEIGRGHPTYKRALKNIKLPSTNQNAPSNDEEDKDEEDNAE